MTYPASFRLNLRVPIVSASLPVPRLYVLMTHVQRAYRNPPKQNAAMSISTTNCTIIARRDKTMRLFLNVTNANLKVEENHSQDNAVKNKGSVMCTLTAGT